jgi:hypothetical protein
MRACRRCRQEYEPPASTAPLPRLCADCLPLECDAARIHALGLPALAWRHFPGRRFTHLAAAAWLPIESFAERLADQVLGAVAGVVIMGRPFDSAGTTVELGLAALDDRELSLVSLTNSRFQNADQFDIKKPALVRSLDFSRVETIPLGSVPVASGEQEQIAILELGGERPRRLLFPEAYLPGNLSAGLTIARALRGEPVPRADYRAAYDALEAGQTFAPRADLHLAIPATDTLEAFAAAIVPGVLRGDPDQGWLFPSDLSDSRRQNAINTFAPTLPPDAILALLDTTWMGTGEAGILLTVPGVYFKIHGLVIGDWTQSWHQGCFAWSQVEDVVVQEGVDGRSLEVSLFGGEKAKLPMEQSSSYDFLGRVLNQIALFNEHQRLYPTRIV